MKTEAIKLVTNSIKSLFTPNAEKVVNVAMKDGEKAMATAQDAMAVQGKAMVKKAYIAPETKTVKISKQEMMAASGNGGGSTHWEDDGEGPGGRPGETGWAKQQVIWSDQFDPNW